MFYFITYEAYQCVLALPVCESSTALAVEPNDIVTLTCTVQSNDDVSLLVSLSQNGSNIVTGNSTFAEWTGQAKEMINKGTVMCSSFIGVQSACPNINGEFHFAIPIILGNINGINAVI